MCYAIIHVPQYIENNNTYDMYINRNYKVFSIDKSYLRQK